MAANLRTWLPEWDRQPQDLVGVASGTPITSGLGLAFNAANNGFDEAGGRVATIGPGGITYGVGPFGARISGVSANQGNLRFSSMPVATAYTLMAVVRDHTQGAYRQFYDADGSTARVFIFRLTPSNTLEFIPFNTGGSPFFALSSTTVDPQSLQVLVATVDAAQLASVYVNGKQSGTTATVTGTVQTLASQYVALGNAANIVVNNAFLGDIYAAFYWSRALSPAEILELSRNPWQLFEPRRIIVPVAAAGGTTHTATLTESASLTDAAVSVLLAAAAASESISAADAIAAILSATTALSESASAADASTTTATQAGDLTESITATDAITALSTLAAALQESVTADDLVAAVMLAQAAVSEAITAADDQTTGPVTTASLIESASAADALTAAALLVAALAENATAADAQTAAAQLVALITETVSLADAQSTGNPTTHSVSITELAVALDTLYGVISGTVTPNLEGIRLRSKITNALGLRGRITPQIALKSLLGR